MTGEVSKHPMHEVSDYPSYIGLAVSYRCNYRCLGCLHGMEEAKDFIRSRQAFMDPDLFRAVADEIAERHPPINLTSPGETLLHPEIYDLIAYAAERNILVEFDTNGSTVDPERLATCGVKNVTFAVDGFDQEAYQSYRRGGNLQNVLDNLENTAAAVRRTGSDLKIYVKFLLNAFTEGTLDDAKRYFSAMPEVVFMVDFFIPPVNSVRDRVNRPAIIPIDVWDKWRSRLHDLDLFYPDPESGEAVHKSMQYPFDGRCYSPYKNLYINTDGEAFACCSLALTPDMDRMKPLSEYSFGNVAEEGVAGVFFGAKATRFREDFARTGGKVDYCARCWANRVDSQQQVVVKDNDVGYKTLLDWPAE